ncbi:MAG: circadian clock protein KaiA [Cyanobacteria bacterium P01_D01_bin.73]
MPRSKLVIAAFIESDWDEKLIQQGFSYDQAILMTFQNAPDFISYLEGSRHELDGIILEVGPSLSSLVAQLYQRAILLPAIIFSLDKSSALPSLEGSVAADLAVVGGSNDDSSLAQPCYYHQAEVQIFIREGDNEFPWETHLQESITNFLNLHTKSALHSDSSSDQSAHNAEHYRLLTSQQRRLAEKLQVRLGYLDVYCKREQKNFLRNLIPEEQEKLIAALRGEYRAIVLSYFDDDADTNLKIDNLVDTAFFADISVSKMVEIHMWLMDEFSKQLKLEGRSPEILLDYRLTLIDIIAHLCEMYRRSVPRDP